MELISAKEAAKKWGISQRRVAVLCAENRIAGAKMVGNMWIIPSNAEKPVDARNFRYTKNEKTAKPFVKWAGGKSQLLDEIRKKYPEKIERYCEPFVGGGAVLFDVISNFQPKEILINDINPDLTNAYVQIQRDEKSLVSVLKNYQEIFWRADENERKKIYYEKRELFNQMKISGKNKNLLAAAVFIFLNKTCFNGLYRVNRNGLFNVPMGRYKNPPICDEENLRMISNLLSNVQITCGDYKKCTDFIDGKTFVYIDPPYRPITATASFTSYTENGFGDEQQIELGKFVNFISAKGAKVVASNSDPKNSDCNDNFFDDLYNDYKIERISAKRMINSKGDKRGSIKELLICNC